MFIIKIKPFLTTGILSAAEKKYLYFSCFLVQNIFITNGKNPILKKVKIMVEITVKYQYNNYE